ncbi:Hemicentin-2 like protein [Argiope bruennichi]|uniref:Hemicentin-2 like protein n=1 Tax=Argiope bruennichi TaxID=94029 RepID=A0A8T0FZW8_ARGBR|nr:Hemicentin-2 like protein [Argiope bruennichi]
MTGLDSYSYLVLDGGRAELPCDVNVTTVEDDVTLILWHREDSGSPLYSVDARETTLPSAKHFPSINMSSRAYFNASGSPSVLRIDGVKKSEEGLYRCRVEYRRSRTETTDVLLTVIVDLECVYFYYRIAVAKIPPKEAIIMDEYGQHLRGVIGPYNEGFPLGLACEGEGGDPSPAVKWWRDAELLDDSYYITPQGFARNELLLASLKRTDLMTQLTCQVSNSNLTAPVTSSVIIDMNLKPTDVHITSMYRPLSVGHPAEIVCVARGARPPAQISWWLDGEKVTSRITESTAREENLTVSSLVFNPNKHDNQRNLSCRGDNPQVPDSVLEDTWVLDIHFPPELDVKINKQVPVLEGTDVSMTCVVRANPPIAELEWLKDGQSLGPPARRDTRNRTLNIASTSIEHKGRYQCSAINSEGKTFSEPKFLQVHYAPRCHSVRSRVYGVGRTESVSVACEVDASPSEVSFTWALDGAKILAAEQYHTNGTHSVATVSPRSPQDYGVLMCWASNVVGRQREPCTFRIIPAGPPEEPKNCIITNRTVNCIYLECERGHDGGLQQLFQLEVFGTDSDKFLANVTAHNAPVFTVCSLPPKESFVLVAYAINSKGKSKQIAIHASTMSLNGNNDDDDSGTFIAVLGVVIGTISVLILLGVVILLTVKLHSKRRASKGREYRNDETKTDSHLTKECKEPCVASSQGPDIIPEKSYFQERSDSLPKVIEVEQGVNPSLSTSDPSNRKYREFQSVSYPDDPTLITTPQKLHITKAEGEIEILDSRSTVETPLISSINPILQQWPNHKKETIRLSTPV